MKAYLVYTDNELKHLHPYHIGSSLDAVKDVAVGIMRSWGREVLNYEVDEKNQELEIRYRRFGSDYIGTTKLYYQRAELV